jgi:hypothetical protein
VTGRGTLTALPGGHVDQVARWHAFKTEHPSAEYSHHLSGPAWTGGITVAGEWRRVRCADLEHVLDALERLALMDADAASIEAVHPGWLVRICEHAGFWHWLGVEREPGDRYPLGPPLVCADSAAGLRAALSAFGT